MISQLNSTKSRSPIGVKSYVFQLRLIEFSDYFHQILVVPPGSNQRVDYNILLGCHVQYRPLISCTSKLLQLAVNEAAYISHDHWSMQAQGENVVWECLLQTTHLSYVRWGDQRDNSCITKVFAEPKRTSRLYVTPQFNWNPIALSSIAYWLSIQQGFI